MPFTSLVNQLVSPKLHTPINIPARKISANHFLPVVVTNKPAPPPPVKKINLPAVDKTYHNSYGRLDQTTVDATFILREKYKYTYKQIAEHLNISEHAVTRRIRFNLRTNRSVLAQNPKNRKRAIEMRDAGISMYAIAQDLGINYSTVRMFFLTYDKNK